MENSTLYPYRDLSRTHRLFYYHRADDQLAPSADRVLPLRDIGNVNVYEAVLSVTQDAPYEHVYWADLAETMDVPEVIALLVEVGGFEPVGARELVADVLGYTPDTLPSTLDFLIRADGTEENLDEDAE